MVCEVYRVNKYSPYEVMNSIAKRSWLKGNCKKVKGLVVGGLGGTEQHHSLFHDHLSTTELLISLMACRRLEGAPVALC